jgi:ureidoglycolate dehydrogenase (NAD+)
MATTTVPYGRIALAKSEGRTVPESWGFDANGHPTTDPEQIVGLHPIAGAKGSGLAAIIDVLSNLFVGAHWGPHIVKMYGEMDKPRRLGHHITVWRIDAFRELREFVQDMDAMIRELHALPPADGFAKVYYPGELEFERAAERERDGVPIDDGLFAELNDLAKRSGLKGIQ